MPERLNERMIYSVEQIDLYLSRKTKLPNSQISEDKRFPKKAFKLRIKSSNRSRKTTSSTMVAIWKNNYFC